jgi:hypothetical protein
MSHHFEWEIINLAMIDHECMSQHSSRGAIFCQFSKSKAYGLSLWRWRRIQVSSSCEMREKKGKRERTYLDTSSSSIQIFAAKSSPVSGDGDGEPFCELPNQVQDDGLSCSRRSRPNPKRVYCPI